MKKFNTKLNVLDAARDRISFLFDEFENINVSISSGKDSTVLYHLVLQEAIKRKRKIYAFFLDQEAEYQASIDVIEHQLIHPNVIPLWYQVPIYMTNSTSLSEYFLYAWGPGEEWIREKNDLAIKEIEEDYPQRFYKFFPWYESKNINSAYLVGIRAEEGILRFRAVTKYEGWNGIRWSTITNNCKKFYPIYDWTIYDIWKFIYDYDCKYNKIYDLMFMDNVSIYGRMRVSNLIHEKAYKSLISLPRYEPETYNKLCKRISGISTAMRYASEKTMFSNKILPAHYNTWKDFRDFLLCNIPNKKHKEKFINRFDNQDNDEKMYQKQVGQLLLNDYEGNRGYTTTTKKRNNKERDKWRKIL